MLKNVCKEKLSEQNKSIMHLRGHLPTFKETSTSRKDETFS